LWLRLARNIIRVFDVLLALIESISQITRVASLLDLLLNRGEYRSYRKLRKSMANTGYDRNVRTRTQENKAGQNNTRP
jgi:hypothetical protein